MKMVCGIASAVVVVERRWALGKGWMGWRRARSEVGRGWRGGK